MESQSQFLKCQFQEQHLVRKHKQALLSLIAKVNLFLFLVWTASSYNYSRVNYPWDSRFIPGLIASKDKIILFSSNVQANRGKFNVRTSAPLLITTSWNTLDNTFYRQNDVIIIA